MAVVEGAQVLNITSFAQVPGVLETLTSPLQTFFDVLQWLIGGLFGLYLIFVIMTWWQGRVKLRLLRDIREDLDLLNLHLNVKNFREHPPDVPDKRWEKVMMKLFEDTEKGKPATTTPSSSYIAKKNKKKDTTKKGIKKKNAHNRRRKRS